MNLVYNLVDFFFMNNNEKEIFSYIKKNKKKIIFDVGSFKGKFTEKILKNEPIKIFNSGDMIRDFTYIEDVCEYIIKILKKPPNHKIPFEVFNLGNGKSRKLGGGSRNPGNPTGLPPPLAWISWISRFSI